MKLIMQFVQPPVTLSFLAINILLSTLFYFRKIYVNIILHLKSKPRA
jgi:hypothetical protein